MRGTFGQIKRAVQADRRLILDGSLTLGINLVGTLLLFGMNVQLARVMGEQNFSLFSYAFAILTVLTTLGLFGFDIAVQRFLPTAVEEKNAGELRGYVRRAFQSVLAVTLALVCALLAGTFAMGAAIADNLQTLLIITALAIPGGSFLLLFTACARALNRPVLAAAPRLLFKPTLFIAIIAAFASLQFEVSPIDAMLVEIAVSLALAAIVALIVFRRLIPIWKTTEPIFASKAWLLVSAPLFLNAGFQILNRQVDILILGSFIGANDIGGYVAASRIAQLAAFGLMAINAVLPPLVVKHMVRGETEEVKRKVGIASLAVFAFSMCAAIALWIFGSVFLGSFGVEYIGARPILNILIIGQLLNAMTGSVSYILAVSGHQKILAKVVAAALALNIVMCFTLIPIFGAIGAALAVTITTSLSNLVLLYVCVRRTGINPSILAAIGNLRPM